MSRLTSGEVCRRKLKEEGSRSSCYERYFPFPKILPIPSIMGSPSTVRRDLSPIIEGSETGWDQESPKSASQHAEQIETEVTVSDKATTGDVLWPPLWACTVTDGEEVIRIPVAIEV